MAMLGNMYFFKKELFYMGLNKIKAKFKKRRGATVICHESKGCYLTTTYSESPTDWRQAVCV